jgi:hypothetical protein
MLSASCSISEQSVFPLEITHCQITLRNLSERPTRILGLSAQVYGKLTSDPSWLKLSASRRGAACWPDKKNLKLVSRGSLENGHCIFVSDLAKLSSGDEIEANARRTFRFRFRVPGNIPPTYKGVSVRYSYSVAIGVHVLSENSAKCVQVSTFPFTLYNPTCILALADYTPGDDGEFNYCCGLESIVESSNNSNQSNKSNKSNKSNQSSNADTYASVPQTALRAVDAVLHKYSMPVIANIRKQEKLLAIVSISKPALVLGDSFTVQLDFQPAMLRCSQVSAVLLVEEIVESTAKRIANSVAEFHEYTHNTLTSYFQFRIPLKCTHTFHTSEVSVNWMIKFSFIQDEALEWTYPLRVLAVYPTMRIA